MLRGEIVEGEQLVAILDETGRGLGELRVVGRDEEVEGRLGVGLRHVVVAWEDFRADAPGASDIYYNVFDSCSETLLGERRLETVYPAGTASVREYRVAAAVDGQDAYVHAFVVVSALPTASNNDEAYLLTSSDGGGAFDEPVAVSPAPDNVNADEIALDAEGKSVYLVWTDDRFAPLSGQDDIFFWRSDGAGTAGTFLPADVQLDTDGQGLGQLARVDMDVFGEVVAVVWHDSDFNDHEMHCRVSRNGGDTFGPDVMMEPGAELAREPRVAVDGGSGNVVVVWQRMDFPLGYFSTLVRASADGGLTSAKRSIWRSSTLQASRRSGPGGSKAASCSR